MFFKFFINQWKSFWRGKNIGGSVVARIFLMILFIYLLLIAIAAGILMKDIITKFFPREAPTHIFNGFIIYYFLIDFLVRLQMQELPTLSVQPYLALNITKKSIVNYLNFQTLFSLFNIAPFFIFLPFCLTNISNTYGDLASIAMIVSIISLTVFNNFFTLWIKRKGGNNVWILVAGVAAALALAGLDYLSLLSLRKFSDMVFSSVISYPYLSIIFIGFSIFAFGLNSRFLYQNLYLEELSHKKSEKISTDFPFFDRFGRVGQLAALEVKLILRHKRSRGALFLGIVMAILYGLVLFNNGTLENKGVNISLIFIALFVTSIFQISYGQFMFAWQSGHFDGLLANRIKTGDYIKAKFLLFNLFGAITAMFCLLFAFISWEIVFIMLCMILYSIGFGSVIVLFFANYNKKRLDLTRGVTFNYQGSGATQWIMAIPIMLTPILIFVVFDRLFQHNWGQIAIGTFGLLTLSMQELWIRWLTKLFNKQRYKIAEGFRE